jgi:hypothetical protein
VAPTPNHDGNSTPTQASQSVVQTLVYRKCYNCRPASCSQNPSRSPLRHCAKPPHLSCLLPALENHNRDLALPPKNWRRSSPSHATSTTPPRPEISIGDFAKSHWPHKAKPCQVLPTTLVPSRLFRLPSAHGATVLFVSAISSAPKSPPLTTVCIEIYDED